jgi:hypothetical protein
MEDSLFSFHEDRKKRVIDFFTRIAPRVQQGNSIFQFIDDLASDRNIRTPIHFFSEITEFIRNVHLARQAYLRKIDLSEYIDKDYQNIIIPVVKSLYTAELREIAQRISLLINKITYNNVTPAAVLPGFLIDIARWYQKALIKNSRKAR